MSDALTWSAQQQTAIATAAAWLRIRYAPFFYLAGYAGTGKTTLAKHIASLQNGKVRYAAFTGKAAKVMRAHGCAGATTIHSLIYDTERDDQTGKIELTLKGPSTLDGTSLIIIDECSMVDDELGRDLLSFGVPVLALGDPGQLPPVRGGGFFTAGEPTYMLTDIHRQAKDSPIIRLATAVRERRYHGQLVDFPGLRITRKGDLDPSEILSADAVLVGRNATRTELNAQKRAALGFKNALPTVGETVICLRNDKSHSIFNGETFVVSKRGKTSRRNEGRIVRLTLTDPDEPKRKPVSAEIFEQFFQDDDAAKEAIGWKALRGTQQFTFGYAITVHKSQGSQWPRVLVFDESSAFRDDAARHLYTAVTRAADHLTLVV